LTAFDDWYTVVLFDICNVARVSFNVAGVSFNVARVSCNVAGVSCNVAGNTCNIQETRPTLQETPATLQRSNVTTVYQQCTNRQKQSNSKNDYWSTNRHMSTQCPPNTQSLFKICFLGVDPENLVAQRFDLQKEFSCAERRVQIWCRSDVQCDLWAWQRKEKKKKRQWQTGICPDHRRLRIEVKVCVPGGLRCVVLHIKIY